MWETLSVPWQAALEMAWEAYCHGSIPIGAVIAGADGVVLSRGRNRIFEKSAPEKEVCDNPLAHAELNALLSLDLNHQQRHSCAIYTTVEPCPLCMGALYMSGLRSLHYAAADPYAGSANLLGKTSYLGIKPIKIFPPSDPALEIILTAIAFEAELNLRQGQAFPVNYLDSLQAAQPQAVDLGFSLHRSGRLRSFQAQGLPAAQVFNQLQPQVQ